MKSIRLVLLLLCVKVSFAQKLLVGDLSCEHKINPMGTGVNPRFSWKLSGSGRNILQTAYSIRVSASGNFRNDSWESGRVAGSESLLQPYAGAPLQPGKRYYWQVKVWDDKNASAWSAPAWFETGLPAADWKAQWIEPVQVEDKLMPGLLLRKEFSIEKKISSARVYITSHGFYELHLNGKKVGDEIFTPGWTSYKKRLQYQVFDISSLLHVGKNSVGAMLADGWYRSALAWDNNWAIWGKKLGLLCQLQISFTDGSTQTIVSDDSWKGSQDGPVTKDGIYVGESYDARKEIAGWDKPGFDDAAWKPVSVSAEAKDNLVFTETVPVKKIQEIKPLRIFKTPKGLLVADFGQNMVGWVRLKVKGSAGTKVTIRHAEVLDKSGNFYTDNLRSATATTEYTLKGGDEETYEPRFSFFGFRYISIDGFPGGLKPENITGVVIHSDMKPTGTFDCSDALVNQLQHNIQWGQKGNFVDVPTDCPQRDERLGWTGDAQAFCRTAAFNMDVAAFFTKWLKDVSADQDSDGKVPFVIPDVLRNHATSAGWGDVSVIAPWTMYQVYGDKRILETQYSGMKSYVEYIRKAAGETYLWKGGSVFGDWLFYKSMAQTENDGYTSPDMIATMFYAHSVQLIAQVAGVLGKTEEARDYNNLFEKIRETFNRNYVTPEGRIASESQTSYVLALEFELLPDSLRPKATDYLVDDIKGRGNHLSTGFLGTPYLCHVLSANGRTDVAYDLLLQKTYPSWLYPVKMGATTIWERWDGQKTDSTFEDVSMNSFNHYAYGAIGDWMYRVVAGIEIGSPGYRHILIQPHPDKKFTCARSTFESGYGTIASGWELNNGKLTVKVTIPPNTGASVRLPGAKTGNLTENGVAAGSIFKQIRQDKNDVVIEAGSGEYSFSYDFSSGN